MAITSGQPTSCRLDYCELAHNDCLIGATTGRPGDFFGVTRRTHSGTGSPLTRTSENDRRKGRKGRKPPATFRRVGFTNDINHVDGRGGGRFAPLGVAETGGNWRKLAETPCRNSARETVRIFLSHFWGAPQWLDISIACGNCGNSPTRPAAGWPETVDAGQR
jgi:hypothetical protein